MSELRRKRQAQKAAQTSGSGLKPVSVSRSGILIALGLAGLLIVTYAPVYKYGFLRFDDTQYVSENPYIVRGLNGQTIAWAFTSGYAANWHPLTWISHAIDVQLYGLNAGPHHATNVALHAANTILLFFLLARMTGAKLPSAMVAGLFGLHPIHVESVAWVAERKDVLSTFFWMLTVFAYTSYASQPQRRSRYVLVIFFFILALMAKPMVVTLPFVLLLFDIWPLRRLSFDTQWRTKVFPLIVEKLPLFALSVASSAITFAVQKKGGTVAVETSLAFATRLANAVTSYVYYLGKAFWPAHLAAYYPYTLSPPTFPGVGGLLLLVLLTVMAIALARSRPYVFVGWFWYLGTLVPAIGLIQAGTQSMADRYTYIPLVGIFIIVAWGLWDLLRERQTVMIAAAAALLVVCTVLTRIQVGYWENNMSLWKHALDVTTENYAAHTFVGNALAAQGDVDQAILHYTEALRIRPNHPEAHNNIGPALARKGRVDEAITHFSEAIRLWPSFVDAHNNLGFALASQGRLNEAIAQYTETLRLDPDYARAHSNLGYVYQAQGKIEDARREFEIALRLNPNFEDVRKALNALKNPR
jgi:tetratricopeptide (TPR) repeat protein